jgi:hypothetical protein
MRPKRAAEKDTKKRQEFGAKVERKWSALTSISSVSLTRGAIFDKIRFSKTRRKREPTRGQKRPKREPKREEKETENAKGK